VATTDLVDLLTQVNVNQREDCLLSRNTAMSGAAKVARGRNQRKGFGPDGWQAVFAVQQSPHSALNELDRRTKSRAHRGHGRRERQAV
jgi:hypothetical protein